MFYLHSLCQVINPHHQVINSLCQVINPPHQVVNPPRQVINPPRQVINPPRQVINPPRQVINPPRQVINPPHQVINPPRQVINPSCQVINPPHQVINPSSSGDRPYSPYSSSLFEPQSPPTDLTDLPQCLSSLFNPEILDDDDLDEVCAQALQNMVISHAQARNLYFLTKQQSDSKDWFEHRVGRITASQMHNVLRYRGRKYPSTIV